jgi:magnesium transporter
MIRSFIFSQSQGRLISQDVSLDLLRIFLQDEGAQFWIDAGEMTDEEAKELLEGVFHFHPLAIEDCLTPSDRPKVDEYPDCVFLVIHAVDYARSQHGFKTSELNMFIGKNFLVTYHREPLRSIDATVERVLRNAPAVARAPDKLTYTILDLLLENYAPSMESLSRELMDLENDLFTNPSKDVLEDVMKLRAEVQKLREIVGPQREVIARLAHAEFKIVRQHMLPYYRDLLDQLVRISTMADNYRDSIINTLQIHLNLQQMQVNRVIKVLTVMATLSMPIVVITSFYGMNVPHWPHNPTLAEGYAWVFGSTAFITAGMYILMKKKGWW